LIRKSSLRGDFHQRVIRFRQERLRDLNSAQNQVTMWGGPKGSPERSREVADGEPAFLGERRQSYPAVQVLL
jgi:hypothetical protein